MQSPKEEEMARVFARCFTTSFVSWENCNRVRSVPETETYGIEDIPDWQLNHDLDKGVWEIRVTRGAEECALLTFALQSESILLFSFLVRGNPVMNFGQPTGWNPQALAVLKNAVSEFLE